MVSVFSGFGTQDSLAEVSFPIDRPRQNKRVNSSSWKSEILYVGDICFGLNVMENGVSFYLTAYLKR